jgi:hypothetical protein
MGIVKLHGWPQLNAFGWLVCIIVAKPHSLHTMTGTHLCILLLLPWHSPRNTCIIIFKWKTFFKGIKLFCNLFSDKVPTAVPKDMTGWSCTVKEDWTEVVMAYFKVLLWYLLGGRTQQNCSQNVWSPNQYLKWNLWIQSRKAKTTLK